MADKWGGSWGTSWGTSWDGAAPAAPTADYNLSKAHTTGLGGADLGDAEVSED